MLANFDVSYSPSKTDFQKIIFLDADFNQISFKNGSQSEHGWSQIDVTQRKNYRVIIDCSNSKEKLRSHYER